MSNSFDLSNFFIQKDCLIREIWQAKDETHWSECQYNKAFANAAISSIIVSIICIIIIIILVINKHPWYAFITTCIGITIIGLSLGVFPSYVRKKAAIEYNQFLSEYKSQQDKGVSWNDYISQYQQRKANYALIDGINRSNTRSNTGSNTRSNIASGLLGTIINKKNN